MKTLVPETSASTIPPPGLITCAILSRAENETRTRDPNLGKVVLYQLSYFRIYLGVFSQTRCKSTTFFHTLQIFSHSFFTPMALLIEFLEITYCYKSKNLLVIPVQMAAFAPLQSIFPMF